MSRVIPLVLVATIILSACGARPQDCASPDVVCAGLVTDFGNVKSGLARQAWLGLQDAEGAKLVDRVDVIETVDARDRLANIRTLATEGYDVIVTSGAGIADQTTAAAAQYPNLVFIGVEQPQATPQANLAGLVFHEEYGGFLAGALAALVSRTGHVAAICEPRYIEPMRRYCGGFEAGARYMRSDIGVSVTYYDGEAAHAFNDPDWGRSTALQQVNEGADVVFAAGAQTADAALQAAAGAGAYVIGAESDRYLDLPTVRPELLTSATSDVRSGIVEILTLVRRGRFPAGDFMGDVKLAPWHDLDRQVPADVKGRLLNINLGLKMGTLKIDVPYQQP